MLVESAPATFRNEPEDLVVALSPEACYELDRRGIPYKLTTDFGTDEAIAALEPEHWREQLEWIEALDETIAAHVPATKRWRFGAATLDAYHLKTLVDPVRIRALELSPLLETCERVILHRRADASLTSRVLSLLAHARGLELEERVERDPEARPEADRTIAAASPLPPGILERLKAWRTRTAAGRKAVAADLPLTLLLADYGYDLPHLLARARERGHRCLRVVGDAVLEDEAEVGRLPVEGRDSGWAAAAEAIALPGHAVWDWPSGWIPGVPLAEVVRPSILHWLRDTMPRIASRAETLRGILENERVDYVLGANIVEPDVVAAAAVTTPPTQSVLVDHGHATFASELFDQIMLSYVDHDFCATSELARYMESRRLLYDRPTAELHVGSYRWRESVSRSRPRSAPERLPEGKPVVVYALTSTAGSVRYLNSPWFCDGWYYRLCREIIDVLARHPEVHSIVKPFPRDGVVRNPIDLYVRDLALDHVVVSRVPLQAWIPWADRIIFDLPSTGLFETAAAGVPYLALLYAHHRHRPEAVAQLGSAAVSFTEPTEAADAVESFIAAPTVAAPRLAPEGDEILLTLERLARR